LQFLLYSFVILSISHKNNYVRSYNHVHFLKRVVKTDDTLRIVKLWVQSYTLACQLHAFCILDPAFLKRVTHLECKIVIIKFFESLTLLILKIQISSFLKRKKKIKIPAFYIMSCTCEQICGVLIISKFMVVES